MEGPTSGSPFFLLYSLKYDHFWPRIGGLALAVEASALRRQHWAGCSDRRKSKGRITCRSVFLGITPKCFSQDLLLAEQWSTADGLRFPNPGPGCPPPPMPPHRYYDGYLPARLVLAPVEAGEELLLVSPARDVRLEWKVGVGRFNLLPVDGITLKKKVTLTWWNLW